jgi:hypothetical protein
MLANVASSESSIIGDLFGFSSFPFSDIAQKGLRILLGALIALASAFLLIMDDTVRTEPRPPMVCVKLPRSVLVVFHLVRATELPNFRD